MRRAVICLVSSVLQCRRGVPAVARVVVLGAALLAAPVHAGGLYVPNFATPSEAMVGAGAQALGLDASTALNNPASMTRLDDHQFMSGAGFLMADVHFDASSSTPFPTGDGGDQGGFGPILSTHYVHRLLDRKDAEYFDRLRAGLSIISISAAVLDPSDSWAGRFEVQELSLLTLTAMPSLAVRVTDGLSVGVGALLTYGVMDYELAAPLPGPGMNEGTVKFDGIDDFDAGATVSLFWEATERTRLGVLWQQEVELDLDGDLKFKGPGPNPATSIETKIPLAQAVRVGIFHELTPELSLGASFRWEDWSAFNKQFVRVAGFTGDLDRGWEDTYGGSVGLRWQFAPSWRLLTGVGYDSSPVSSGDRTADLPIDQQVRFGLGTQYKWGEHRTVGANFTYTWLGESRIRSETLRGSYDRNQLFTFTFYIAFAKLPWSRL